MNTDKILDTATEAALNAGCKVIQDALGIKSGDFASQHFSETNGELMNIFREYADGELSHQPHAVEQPDCISDEIACALRRAGWTDQSWHNDTCVRFYNPDQTLVLWIEYEDESQRESGAKHRFELQTMDAEGHMDADSPVHQCEYWREMSEFLNIAEPIKPMKLAFEFAKVLNRWLGSEKMAIVNQLNDAGDNCASHQFCDSNMAMLEACEVCNPAFDFDPADGAQADLMNEAWSLAQRFHFDTKILGDCQKFVFDPQGKTDDDGTQVPAWGFLFDGDFIHDTTVSPCGRFPRLPREYNLTTDEAACLDMLNSQIKPAKV